MKRKHTLFTDIVSGTAVYLYVDKYNVEWVASHIWTDRILRNDKTE